VEAPTTVIFGQTMQCETMLVESTHKACLNHPLELEIPVTNPETEDHILLMFQVRQRLVFDRYPVVGYGLVSLRLDRLGTYSSEVGLWRPVIDNDHDDMMRLMLGQSPELSDGGWAELRRMAQVQRPDRVVNRVMSRVQGTGKLNMTLNVVCETKKESQLAVEDFALVEAKAAIDRARAKLAQLTT
jgi:hypothetical protein